MVETGSTKGTGEGLPTICQFRKYLSQNIKVEQNSIGFGWNDALRSCQIWIHPGSNQGFNLSASDKSA